MYYVSDLCTKVKQEAQRAEYRATKYNVRPLLTDWPGWQSWFSDQPEKHTFGRRRCDLASCQVSLNSVRRFLRRSQKCLSHSDAGRPYWFFLIGPKKQKLVEDIDTLRPVNFHWNPFSGFKGEVKMANERQGRLCWFSDQSEKHKLGKECWDIVSCQVSLNSLLWASRQVSLNSLLRFRGEIENVPANQRPECSFWFS